MKILAIESSCDETAAAVVVDGRDVRSNIISTQIPIHTLYGGVVPEIASRKHIERVNQVIRKALSDAGETVDSIDAVAVTYGPGLVGALLVGLNAAKAIAWAADKPLIGVNHIEGHIAANFIENMLFDAEVVVKTCLRSPANVQSAVNVGFGPLHYLSKLTPILNVLKVHLLDGRARYDKSVEIPILNLGKLLIKREKMLLGHVS